jgi:hemerythrin superfamily protein
MAGPDEDVLVLLTRQHQEIIALFDAVRTSSGAARRGVFRDLVRLLSVHEAAEEQIMHPAVRTVPGGGAIADARLAEERRCRELLATLDRIGPDAEGFEVLIEQLQEDVSAHSAYEERYEFTKLRAAYGEDRRWAMGTAVQAFQLIAPTRPHRVVSGPVAGLLLGPPVGMIDRARDLLRSATGG